MRGTYPIMRGGVGRILQSLGNGNVVAPRDSLELQKTNAQDILKSEFESGQQHKMPLKKYGIREQWFWWFMDGEDLGVDSFEFLVM